MCNTINCKSDTDGCVSSEWTEFGNSEMHCMLYIEPFPSVYECDMSCNMLWLARDLEKVLDKQLELLNKSTS